MTVNQLVSDRFEGQSLLGCLESLEDPRLDRARLYPLREVLLVSLCAMVYGYESFRAFSIYGEEKINFLKATYPFENSIPSHDTFVWIFMLLCPKHFSLLLTRWTESLKDNLPGLKHITFDGKTVRGSRKTSNKHSATHVVSAFASQS